MSCRATVVAKAEHPYQVQELLKPSTGCLACTRGRQGGGGRAPLEVDEQLVNELQLRGERGGRGGLVGGGGRGRAGLAQLRARHGGDLRAQVVLLQVRQPACTLRACSFR